MNKNFSITLIQCPCWGRETPPLAIALLAGNLRSKGYRVHLFDLNNELYHLVSEEDKRRWHADEYAFWHSTESVKEIIKHYDAKIETEIKKILEKSSQLVGFSVHHTSINFTLEIASKIKNHSPDTLIILGGPHAAEYLGGLRFLENPDIDAIALREGDETLPQVCSDLKEKGCFRKIPGLVFKKNGEIVNGGLREPIKSLDALPFADYSDFDLNGYADPKRLGIFATRSCINKCHFCHERIYFQRFRFRSGDNLFKEVKYQLSKFPQVRFFNFGDSMFNGSPNALQRFSELLLENNIKINWGGQAIIREYMTPELLRLMAKAGCSGICYGLESGSNNVLRSMNKNLTVETATRIIRETCEAGIKVDANFMFGYPTETEEDFQETLDFIRQNHKRIDGVNPAHACTALIENTYLYENPKEFGIEGNKHVLFWTSQEGKNTYPVRLDRRERFCKLCLELGLKGLAPVEETPNKWELLGKYYQYKKDYQKAMNYYFKDLLKRGYSPESVKGFFECQALQQGREIPSFLPYQVINKLISFYNKKRNSLIEGKKKDSRITKSLSGPKNKDSLKSKPQGLICIYPFVAMSFYYTGDTWNCKCPGWPKYKIGNIKNSTIAELWNSETARWIRRKMYEGKWQDICKPTCPVILDYLRSNRIFKWDSPQHRYERLEEAEHVTPGLIDEIRTGKDYLDSPPAYFLPDVSAACNLRCIMCGQYREQNEEDLAMQKKLWADLKYYLPTATDICFAGRGEPLVRQDTKEVLINYKGPAKFLITTNGLLLPEYWEQIKNQKFGLLNISTDAATKETYEKIRVGGRWENLLNSLDLVKQNRDKFEKIMLNMTVMRSNYKEIPLFIDFTESYGFNCLFQSIRDKFGKENIFELPDPTALEELKNIVIAESAKKRTIDIYWGDLLARLNIPKDIKLRAW